LKGAAAKQAFFDQTWKLNDIEKIN